MKTKGLLVCLSFAALMLAGGFSETAAREKPSDSPPARLPRTNLLVYHGRHGEVRPVKSRADWRKRRAEILRGMQAVMGPLPGQAKRCPLDFRVEEEVDAGRYLRQLGSYAAEPGSRVPTYLLIPKDAPAGRRKFNAILALHPTNMEIGHRTSVEKRPGPYRAYAHDLAERGFVVLVPAYPLMANYQPDVRALGYESGTMKAIWDNIRGLDLLDSLPYVRRGRYGAIGHSLGGHNAIYTAVFDQRIQAVVSSCGFDSFLDYYGGDPANWQPERGWCQTRYMPKLAAYRGRLADIPFDFHELMGALAPRPVFVNAPLGDRNFQWRSVDAIAQTALPIYTLLGAPDKLQVTHPDYDHDFRDPERMRAYAFLAAALQP